jgi:hypothetical protein
VQPCPLPGELFPRLGFAPKFLSAPESLDFLSFERERNPDLDFDSADLLECFDLSKSSDPWLSVLADFPRDLSNKTAEFKLVDEESLSAGVFSSIVLFPSCPTFGDFSF